MGNPTHEHKLTSVAARTLCVFFVPISLSRHWLPYVTNGGFFVTDTEAGGRTALLPLTLALGQGGLR